MCRNQFLSLFFLDQRKQRAEGTALGDLSAEGDSLRRRRSRCQQDRQHHHSAKLPSLVRKIGLRQRWRSLSASRTAASSMSTPSPGPSGTGKKPSTGDSAFLLVQKLSRSCPPVL